MSGPDSLDTDHDTESEGNMRAAQEKTQFGFVLFFGIFRELILKVFQVPWTKHVWFVMVVSSFLFQWAMVFGFKSGCPGLEN